MSSTPLAAPLGSMVTVFLPTVANLHSLHSEQQRHLAERFQRLAVVFPTDFGVITVEEWRMLVVLLHLEQVCKGYFNYMTHVEEHVGNAAALVVVLPIAWTRATLRAALGRAPASVAAHLGSDKRSVTFLINFVVVFAAVVRSCPSRGQQRRWPAPHREWSPADAYRSRARPNGGRRGRPWWR